MKHTAIHRPILELSADGSLTPTGHTSEFSAERTNTFEVVAGSAIRLRGLYAELGLPLSKSPTLLALIEDTETLASAVDDERTFGHLFSALQVQRIAEAILPLAGKSQVREKLAETLDGGISFLFRTRSKAKDTLWELELHRVLSDCGIETRFAEPDLMVALAGSDAGVACKKLYSEANVEKVLSQAIGQIERNCSSGIVALDIEDLLPENAILQVPNSQGMAVRLNAHNDSFMQRHERHLRKYLEPGRAISVVVSCGAMVDILDRSPRFYTARQTTMWNIPNNSPSQSSQVDAILTALLSSHAA
jgi:hypothetical protein